MVFVCDVIDHWYGGYDVSSTLASCYEVLPMFIVRARLLARGQYHTGHEHHPHKLLIS